MQNDPPAVKNPPITVTKASEQNKPTTKPARIKLHRNAKGEYSWDITADNVDEVLKADSKLRKMLKTQEK